MKPMGGIKVAMVGVAYGVHGGGADAAQARGDHGDEKAHDGEHDQNFKQGEAFLGGGSLFQQIP
jgi:hypothetical protein